MKKQTQLMGILNVTPDSFFDQSRFISYENAIARGVQIANEGADILDIGGESTRPGASFVNEEDEIHRVIPVIKNLKEKISIPISIDTMKPKVAAEALEAGASFINDVSGFRDPSMVELAVNTNVKICVMHMLETPQTMQKNPYYEEGIVPHLLKWFSEKIESLIKRGVKKEQIYLDPGIGFGKTVADNLKIIQNLRRIKELGLPLLLGISRKSFLKILLDRSTSELLPATLAVNSLAVLENVEIIRVHDVKEHRDMIDILTYLKKGD